MATQTTHYNLTKPDLTDLVDVTVLNDNFDIIDENIYEALQSGGAAMIESSVEETTTSAHAYAVGDYFIYNNTLYRTTAAISIGDTITPGTNCTAVTVASELEGKQNTLTFDSTPTEGSTNPVTSDGIFEALKTAGAQSDWNESDSTASDYIKNRTHYSENTYITLLTKSTSQHSGSTYTSIGTGTIDSEFYVPGSSNNSFEVTYNGQTTNGHFGNGQGSNSYYWYTLITDDDLGVKLIQYSENTPAGWKYTYDITATGAKPASTFVLKKLSSTTVHKLDNKYLDTETSPTSGSTKPITAGGVYTALAGKINTSAKGAANGVASLDSSGKVPSGQLPSYVDDVIEGYYYNGAFYSDSAHTQEITGETGKIYVDLSTEDSYRWSGSVYVKIANQIEIDATLTQQGEAADAKAVGDELNGVKNTLNHKADVIYDTASGDIASFPDGADGLPVKDLTVGIEPVQSGTGDPSPTNVRPISGWTGANIYHSGGNKFSAEIAEWVLGKYIDTDGNIRNGENYRYTDHYFEVKPSSTIYIKSYKNSNQSSGVAFYTQNKTFIERKYIYISSDPIGEREYYDVVPSNAYYIRINMPNDDAQANTTEIYVCDKITVTFPSNTTVYGGTLDVTSGVLTVDKGIYTFTGNEKGQSNSVGRVYFNIDAISSKIKNPNNRSTAVNMISEKLAVIDDNRLESNSGQMSYYNGNFGVCVVKTSDNGDVTLAKQTLTGMKLVFELATPLVIQLDPVTVTTLLGQNNIWADCGPSTVEYPADMKLYIQKINTPTDDDMIADANIVSGQYFIINNNLYLSTAAILAGDPIKPGTNCTLTNLAAALNALNS